MQETKFFEHSPKYRDHLSYILYKILLAQTNFQSSKLAGSPKSEVSELLFRTSETMLVLVHRISENFEFFFRQVKPSWC